MEYTQVSHYQIQERIGGGVMGQVYRAHDTLLDRQVALKFLPAELTHDQPSTQRFLREAQAASSLDHPNICRVHDIGQTEDGIWYLAMTWYPGRSLKKIVQQGPLDPERALNFAHQIASGLAHAHDQGVIHRDIKPANLMVTEQDEIKIVDFGLALLPGKTRLTKVGTILGTAAYMSPEQARGEVVTAATDIWSLGIVLYEMLAGRLPFKGGSDVGMMHSVVHTKPERLPTSPMDERRDCQTIIDGCLASKPQNRYPSAGALSGKIEMARQRSKDGESGSRKRSGSLAARGGRIYRPMTIAAIAAAIIAVLALYQVRESITGIFQSGTTNPEAGIAVLPFVFIGDEQAESFGLGLSWLVSDRLTRLESESDQYWTVPMTEIVSLKERTPADVRQILGVNRTVFGSGRMQGSEISLRVTLTSPGGESVSTTFEDNASNLRTWQREVVVWIMEQLDPDLGRRLAAEEHPALDRGGTTVPAAFLAMNEGMGRLAFASSPDTAAIDWAIDALARAVAQDSSYACAWTGLGRATYLRYRRSDPEEVEMAASYLVRAAQLDSTSALPLCYLGSIYTRRGENELALAGYDSGLNREPEHALTLTLMGSLQRRLGMVSSAQVTYERAVRARPDYLDAHRDAGVFYYYQGRYEDAAARFARMLEIAPENYQGYNMMGAVLFEMEDYPAAEAMFEKSLAIEPTYSAYSNLGTLYYYSGRFMDAILVTRKAIEMDDSMYNSWRNLAGAYKMAPGYEDSARTAYVRADQLARIELERYPGDPTILADLAAFYAELDEPDSSRAMLEGLAQLDTLETEVKFSMASTYERLGERDLALDWLEKAVAADLSLAKVEHYPTLRNLHSHPRFRELQVAYGNRQLSKSKR